MRLSSFLLPARRSARAGRCAQQHARRQDGRPRGTRRRSSAPKWDADEVEDVIIGCAIPKARPDGTSRARSDPRRLPHTGARHDREPLLLSGLQTIALAAQAHPRRRGEVFVAGGVEIVSLVQNEMKSTTSRTSGCHRHHSRSTGRCCRRPST